MLDLDSPRWAELRQTDATAEHVPALIRALAAGPEHGDDSNPWDEVCISLCQHVWSATCAAFSHIVAIAEANGLRKRAETLKLAGVAGIARVQGHFATDIPMDLLEGFESALTRIRRWSLDTVRRADLSSPQHLPYLLQAFGGLRFPKSAYVAQLDRFYDDDCELEINYCPRCREYILVQFGADSLTALPSDHRGWPIEARAKRSAPDRSTYAEQMQRGSAILATSDDPTWLEPETGGVLAALAAERRNPLLAAHILDIDAFIECPHCGYTFRIAEGLTCP